jgi:hypothetical protein
VHRIEVEFADGKTGVVNFDRFIRKGGVFKRLKDPAFFRWFIINKDFGVLTWGSRIDIAPETLYAEPTGAARQSRVAQSRARYG